MPPGVSLSDFYYILPELVLTGGALLVLIADVLLPRDKRAALAWVTLLALGATAATLPLFTRTHVEVAHGLIAVDQFSLFFKALFLGAAAITVLMSIRYLATEGAASPGEYYFLILCATLGMMIMAGGIDLITIFIGLETMAVSFYILAGYIKPNQRSNEAAVKYFLLGAFSLGILLYGMSLMYGLSGTTNLRVMATSFEAMTGDPRRWPNEPGFPGAVHFFGPYPYRSPFHATSEAEEGERALRMLARQPATLATSRSSSPNTSRNWPTAHARSACATLSGGAMRTTVPCVSFDRTPRASSRSTTCLAGRRRASISMPM